MSACAGMARQRCTVLLILAAISFLAKSGSVLYSRADHVALLDYSNLDGILYNSSKAWVLEFYASWCGHCINFARVWKALAMDIKDWQPALSLAVVHCANPMNRILCQRFGVTSYPTIKLFKAFSKPSVKGELFKGPERSVSALRHYFIDHLEAHDENVWPPACPPLEPISMAEVQSFFAVNDVLYLALIFEEENSYIGREDEEADDFPSGTVLFTVQGKSSGSPEPQLVNDPASLLASALACMEFPRCPRDPMGFGFLSHPKNAQVTLDMLQYENIAVRRVLKSDESLVKLFGVQRFPSCYLYFNDTSHRAASVKMETRIFYTYYLRRLPGVTRGAYKLTTENGTSREGTETWKDFSSSKLYMSDLESALYYSLKMEVVKRQGLSGDNLMALKDFITVLTKYFPGRPFIMKLLQITDAWLREVGTGPVSSSALMDVLNNKKGVPGAALPDKEHWVGCQGSRPYFRGYPCSVWTLFHFLTVQAAKKNNSMVLAGESVQSDPLEVLSAMRQYVKHFFGCRVCAVHFESMAAASMNSIQTFNEAILWLWSRHNRVNSRLAGALSEDPKFPKIQWPPPDMCEDCHNDNGGHHEWIFDAVLNFFNVHYSLDNIDYSYLEEEKALLKKQQKVREDTWQGQERIVPEEEGKRDLVEDKGKEEKEKSTEPPMMNEERRVNQRNVRRIRSQKRSFVKWKHTARRDEEDIVDLDLFVNEQYKKQALKDRAENERASIMSKKYRGPQLHLQSIDESGESREMQQNWVGLGGDHVIAKKRWIGLMGVNFSRMDTGLCIMLYFLSALSLLSLYLYFKMMFRCWRLKFWSTSACVGIKYNRERK